MNFLSKPKKPNHETIDDLKTEMPITIQTIAYNTPLTDRRIKIEMLDGSTDKSTPDALGNNETLMAIGGYDTADDKILFYAPKDIIFYKRALNAFFAHENSHGFTYKPIRGSSQAKIHLIEEHLYKGKEWFETCLIKLKALDEACASAIGGQYHKESVPTRMEEMKYYERKFGIKPRDLKRNIKLVQRLLKSATQDATRIIVRENIQDFFVAGELPNFKQAVKNYKNMLNYFGKMMS